MRRSLEGCSVLTLGVLAALACGPAPAQAQDAAVTAGLKSAATALQQGRADQAVQLLSEALNDRTLANDRRGVILNDRGVAYLKQLNVRAAIDDFNRAAQLYPEYAPLYSNRGNALIVAGHFKEAIKDYDRAIVLSPGFAAAIANRAVAHARLGAHDRALADFTRAIDLAPQNAAALTGRGQSQLALERPYIAIRDFTRATALDSRFVGAYKSRAEARLLIDRFDDAIEDYSRAVTFAPKSVDLLVQRGDAYLARGNAKAALQDFNRVIELDPRSIAGYVGRAMAQAKNSAPDEALTDLGKAIELDPRLPRPYAVRAWVYAEMQKPELGAKDAERAVKLDPNSADAHWADGEIAIATGRTDAATAAFSKALGLNNRHRGTLDALAKIGLVASREETEVAGAKFETWKVMQSGDLYVAVQDGPPTLRVPLELFGPGVPKLLEWERKRPPFANIGVLRFTAGAVEPASGGAAETVEASAIVDVTAQTVLGIVVGRRGAKTASWTFEDGKIQVNGADGLTDEFVIRKGRDAPAAVAATPPARSSSGSGSGSSSGSGSGGSSQASSAASSGGGSKSGGTPSWAPWAQSPGPTPSKQAARPQKPKTLFEMLFGN